MDLDEQQEVRGCSTRILHFGIDANSIFDVMQTFPDRVLIAGDQWERWGERLSPESESGSVLHTVLYTSSSREAWEAIERLRSMDGVTLYEATVRALPPVQFFLTSTSRDIHDMLYVAITADSERPVGLRR